VVCWVARKIRICSAVLPLLAVISAFGLAVPERAGADMTVAGNMRLVEGVTLTEALMIVRAQYGSIMPARPGDAVFIGDAVKTGERVKATVELGDNTVLTIAPESAVQISGLHIDRVATSRKVVLKVLKGTVRFAVPGEYRSSPGAAEKPWKDSSVVIETVNAVATLRGTDVIVTVTPTDVEIAVLEGIVGVRSALPGARDEVVLKADQISTTGKGSIPGPVSNLAAERRDLLVRRTTLEKGVAEMQALPARSKPAKTYTQNDIARDIAAGVTISGTIDRAVESGMAPEAAVAAVIAAGVSADAVVYTAIQGGYSPSKVVQSALGSGAPSALVFSAALAAGADRQQVMEGAQSAGMPAAAIAGSMASATSGDVRTLGASGASAATPLSVIPPVVVPIGGGGGATPSASPYKP
jgi:hypothetical protein